MRLETLKSSFKLHNTQDPKCLKFREKEMKLLDAATGSILGQLSHDLLLRLVFAALDSLFGGLQKSLELALKMLDMEFGLKCPGG